MECHGSTQMWLSDFCRAEYQVLLVLCPHTLHVRFLSALLASNDKSCNSAPGSSLAALRAGAQCSTGRLEYWGIYTPGSNTQPMLYGNGWVEPQPPHPLGGITQGCSGTALNNRNIMWAITMSHICTFTLMLKRNR